MGRRWKADVATKSHSGSNSSKTQTKLILVTQEPDKANRIHIFMAKPQFCEGNSAKIPVSLMRMEWELLQLLQWLKETFSSVCPESSWLQPNLDYKE
ncbi:hypothetical protein WISP_107105 [Willisornis vidua]|uniref:Uncharacterized protein n=1 Tax=Willisornis vidua TaxID=1566151 RepID=A0ABQ9D227_9PASS|nr:hypothetical protein WISP_107105 [Willisornis vidua]